MSTVTFVLFYFYHWAPHSPILLLFAAHILRSNHWALQLISLHYVRSFQEMTSCGRRTGAGVFYTLLLHDVGPWVTWHCPFSTDKTAHVTIFYTGCFERVLHVCMFYFFGLNWAWSLLFSSQGSLIWFALQVQLMIQNPAVSAWPTQTCK